MSFVVLGVTGGVSAYKSVEVCRQLTKSGAHVAVIPTESSLRFVGEATWVALASEPPHISLWEDEYPIPHTHLGQHADLIVVCPATARLIGSYAAGISEDVLTATLLATRAPVLVCPAMHTEMWEHPAVQDNLQTLRNRGVRILEPEAGVLAGGDEGTGRLPDPERIVAEITQILGGPKMLEATQISGAKDVDSLDRHPHASSHSSSTVAHPHPTQLATQKVLVTAGGTREPLDLVRYIGNRSSGKQGYAIAEEALARGAQVHLIATVEQPISEGINLQLVSTAAEMHQAVLEQSADADIVVMAAAVADFAPVEPQKLKHKKSRGVPDFQLAPTPDILAELGQRKSSRASAQTAQTAPPWSASAGAPSRNRAPLSHAPASHTLPILVGFAAEACSGAEELKACATQKLTDKGADVIVANDISADDTGFESDNNEVLIVTASGHSQHVPATSKQKVAASLFDLLCEQFSLNASSSAS